MAQLLPGERGPIHPGMGYQTHDSQATGHNQSAGQSREAWWVAAALCLVRKLKRVKAFSEK